MKPRNILFGFALVLVCAAPVFAQEQRWDVGGSLTNSSNQALHDLTQTSLGFGAELGYQGKLAATTVPFRVGFGINLFPGKEENQKKISLTNMQLTGDLYINTGYEYVKLITGLSFNKWKIKSDKLDTPAYSYSNNVKGIKFGGRIGMEYRINERLTTSLLWQVTELGTDVDYTPDVSHEAATKNVNPSWLQVGVKYHF